MISRKVGGQKTMKKILAAHKIFENRGAHFWRPLLCPLKIIFFNLLIIDAISDICKPIVHFLYNIDMKRLLKKSKSYPAL